MSSCLCEATYPVSHRGLNQTTAHKAAFIIGYYSKVKGSYRCSQRLKSHASAVLSHIPPGHSCLFLSCNSKALTPSWEYFVFTAQHPQSCCACTFSSLLHLWLNHLVLGIQLTLSENNRTLWQLWDKGSKNEFSSTEINFKLCKVWKQNCFNKSASHKYLVKSK